jgi:hypothetical protein
VPRGRRQRRHASAAAAAMAALVGTALVAPTAGAELPPVALRFLDPAPLALDATALGRATHRLRVVVKNPGSRAVALPAPVLRFTPIRDGIAFRCDGVREDPRWQRALEPGESVSIDHDLTCDTPLPGRYDVEVRARAAGDGEGASRVVGAFTLTIEPGTKEPVKLPWDPHLFAIASGTREIRPGTGAAAGARVVVALVNGTPREVQLSSARASVRVLRRVDQALACADRVVDLAYAGGLAPGRSQTAVVLLPCDFSAEGAYDVYVSLLAGDARVALPRHAIRVAAVPTPPSPPPAGGLIGGY